MNIVIINQQKKYKVPRLYISEVMPQIAKYLLLKKIISKLDMKKEVNLVFVSSKDIRRLNHQFRKKDKPTDILSFSSLDPSMFGELILCPEIIFQNAKTNSWPQKYEYFYMLIHGLLHLSGFDHEIDDEAKKMFKIQDEIFNKISVGPKVTG